MLEQAIQEQRIDQLSSPATTCRASSLSVILPRTAPRFNMVPDLFRHDQPTEFNHITGIPLLGISCWPLDKVWNRIRRIFDIALARRPAGLHPHHGVPHC